MATSSDTSENVKSRRPAESAFKQQRLPAWQPILTAGTVLPTFFVIGIAFIPVGVGLLYFSDEGEELFFLCNPIWLAESEGPKHMLRPVNITSQEVKEVVVNYTHCSPPDSELTCAELLRKQTPCKCSVKFNLTEDFAGSVYMYYGLTNYYQNHRRYVKSRDDQQLLGRLSMTPSSDCEPFAYEDTPDGKKKPIAPCGAIANSLFNDVLTLRSLDLEEEVPLLRYGIAWSSDRNIKFQNPPGDLRTAFQNFSKPKNWKMNIWELDLKNESNNGFQNEDLIVWMRTAALPSFRKLYRRIDHSVEHFKSGLLHGLYEVNIDYNYEVTEFDGTKSMILSTTSLLGGKNPFLGVAYIVVGCLCLLLGIILLVIHVKCSKSTTEMINVNPRTPYS